jgi:pimeloyl-ACP methyl ester carboxylesterase
MLREDPEIPERYRKYLQQGDAPPTPQPRGRDVAAPASRRPTPRVGAPAPAKLRTRLWALLMYCPIRRSQPQEKLTLQTVLWRMLEGLVLRALLAPLIIALFMGVVVHVTTHPARVQAELTPATLGLPYRSVSIPVADGLVLDGWFVPALDPETVAAIGSAGAAIRRPGVVLVHGLGLSQDSCLGLANRLYKRGYAVLMISTRGQGNSGDAAVTFGLRESADVRAAVAYLRTQPGVRGDAIAAVGFGTGGLAVLRANAEEPLAAVVADSVWYKMDEYVAEALRTRPEFPTENLASFYRMGFEAMTGQAMADWKLSDALSNARNHPLLLVRQGHERSSLRDVIQSAENVAQVEIIPLGPTETQNTQADKLTVKFLTEKLGKY